MKNTLQSTCLYEIQESVHRRAYSRKPYIALVTCTLLMVRYPSPSRWKPQTTGKASLQRPPSQLSRHPGEEKAHLCARPMGHGSPPQTARQVPSTAGGAAGHRARARAHLSLANVLYHKPATGMCPQHAIPKCPDIFSTRRKETCDHCSRVTASLYLAAADLTLNAGCTANK